MLKNIEKYKQGQSDRLVAVFEFSAAAGFVLGYSVSGPRMERYERKEPRKSNVKCKDGDTMIC